ncbi:PLD nuclease N-terminal domain-containing protein [Arthrobacter sp. PvP102]|uniref:PLD nuclease N-terminal domain-containing protein n=1 Tax=unclassified Arthrobacter TaxID=235627 RepID=UPI0035A8361F
MLSTIARSTITNPVIPGSWLALQSVVALAYVALLIGAWITIFRAKDQPPRTLFVWAVIVFVLPFIGPLLWFIGGRKASQRNGSLPS